MFICEHLSFDSYVKKVQFVSLESDCLMFILCDERNLI